MNSATTPGWRSLMRFSSDATICSICDATSSSANSRLSATTIWSGARRTVGAPFAPSTPVSERASSVIDLLTSSLARSPMSSSLVSRAPRHGGGSLRAVSGDSAVLVALLARLHMLLMRAEVPCKSAGLFL